MVTACNEIILYRRNSWSHILHSAFTCGLMFPARVRALTSVTKQQEEMNTFIFTLVTLFTTHTDGDAERTGRKRCEQQTGGETNQWSHRPTLSVGAVPENINGARHNIPANSQTGIFFSREMSTLAKNVKTFSSSAARHYHHHHQCQRTTCFSRHFCPELFHLAAW